jgi:hypothetical protein
VRFFARAKREARRPIGGTRAIDGMMASKSMSDEPTQKNEDAPEPIALLATPEPTPKPIAPATMPEPFAPLTTPEPFAPLTTPEPFAPLTTPEAFAPPPTPEPIAPLATPEPIAPLATPEPIAPLATPEPIAPTATTTPEKSAPLWQWLVVGVGGTLAIVVAARSATTLDDARPVVPASTAPTPASVTSIDLMPGTPGMPHLPGSPAMNTAPLLTVSAGPLAGGFDSTVKDGGKRGASSAKKGKDSYPNEGLALDAAQAALDRKEPVKASAILDQYDKDWPSGLLSADARALRIEALALKQQDTQALSLATKFLEDYPHSPKAGRVRGIADQLRARGAK